MQTLGLESNMPHGLGSGHAGIHELYLQDEMTQPFMTLLHVFYRVYLPR